MERFRSEFGYSYGSRYAFGYAEYLKLEGGEDAGPAYAQGYLPHSADPAVRDLFYMARSVRVPLASWKPSSENRRIERKFADRFSYDLLTADELARDPLFRDSFLGYFSRTHGEEVMRAERLDGILATLLPLRGVRYRDQASGLVAGYVLEVALKDAVHYWYSSFEHELAGTSFGMWLMLDAVRRAGEEGRAYAYLGTAYGAKGKYKTNLEPLEFWDGTGWRNDPKLLARFIEEDAGRQVPFGDRFANP
jgi:arginyl-tRNA--protein-N-Asp/Glu arginylyltransferase